jgi:putative protease
MQLLVNPINFINALKLIKLGVHQLYVGSKLFSLRNNCNLSINSLKRLVENKTKTKIIILINKIIQEDEIKSLEQYILSICKLNIDGIMFTDYAVAQIIYEHKIKINLIYFSPTLTTNYGQIDFFESNKINEIVLSNELNKIEIKDICKHKSKVKIQLQVFGHVHVMNSK